MKTLPFILALGLACGAVAQPVPPTTSYTRYLLTSTNRAQAQERIGLTNGNAVSATVATNIAGTVHIIRGGVQTKYENLTEAEAALQAGDYVKGAGLLRLTNAFLFKDRVTVDVSEATIENYIPHLRTNGPAFLLSGVSNVLKIGNAKMMFREIGTNDMVSATSQALFGFQESALDGLALGHPYPTNALVVVSGTILAETDIAFFRGPDPASVKIVGGNWNSRWDSILIAEGPHQIELEYANITSVGTNQINGSNERSYIVSYNGDCTGAQFIARHCTFTISNALASYVKGDNNSGYITNLFYASHGRNLKNPPTTEFILDHTAIHPRVLVFDSACTGFRPELISASIPGTIPGGTFNHGTNVVAVIRGGGNEEDGVFPQIGPFTSTTIPFTGILTGNGGGLTSIPATALSSLGADPNADRGVFWDDSAGALKYFTIGSGLTMTDTTLTATGGGDVTQAGQNNFSGSNYFGSGFTINNSSTKFGRHGFTNIWDGGLEAWMRTNGGFPQLVLTTDDDLPNALNYAELTAAGLTFNVFGGATASINGESGAVSGYSFTENGGGFIGLGSALTGDDEAYSASGWNSDINFPTKNAVRDKVEAMAGYVLPFSVIIASSPADSTTYYIGGDSPASANAWTTSGTSYTDSSAVIPRSGTVTRVWMKVRIRTTPGSGETVSTYFRLNNTSDSGQFDATWNSTTVEASNTSVNTAVTAGDTYAIKVVTPAWATNPTGVTIFGFIYIE